MTLDRDVWIALLEVEAMARGHGFSPGDKAFVNALAAGASAEKARLRMQRTLSELGFAVVRVEDLETWRRRCESKDPSAELQRLAEAAARSGETQLDTFHTWEGQG